MNPPEKNIATEDEEKINENSILLTEENAAVIFNDTAEADEDDIELIDLTADDE